MTIKAFQKKGIRSEKRYRFKSSKIEGQTIGIEKQILGRGELFTGFLESGANYFFNNYPNKNYNSYKIKVKADSGKIFLSELLWIEPNQERDINSIIGDKIYIWDSGQENEYWNDISSYV